MTKSKLMQEAERRWVCQVVRSGFHNGAHCRPHDPHDDDWGCGYRWEISVTDARWKALTGRKKKTVPIEPSAEGQALYNSHRARIEEVFSEKKNS